MGMFRKAATMAATLAAWLLSAVPAQAAVIVQGTATIDWDSLSIDGPLLFIDQYTGVTTQLSNETGYVSGIDNSNDWTTPMSVPLALGDDTSTASASASQLQTEDYVTVPTITPAFPFLVAGSVAESTRYGYYEATADGLVTVNIPYSLTAGGMTEYVGERALINVIAMMELYVDGMGPPPVAADIQVIQEDLKDGASGAFTKSGVLSLSYLITSGATGFLAIGTVANDNAEAHFVPEPASWLLLGCGLAVLRVTRSKKLDAPSL